MRVVTRRLSSSMFPVHRGKFRRVHKITRVCCADPEEETQQMFSFFLEDAKYESGLRNLTKAKFLSRRLQASVLRCCIVDMCGDARSRSPVLGAQEP